MANPPLGYEQKFAEFIRMCKTAPEDVIIVKTLGTSNLAADGNQNGQIDAGDYDVGNNQNDVLDWFA